MIYPYIWMVIVGAVVCFLVACGNGANDLANAFGTSYGSRVLTLMQIIVLATCCEFAGAVGLGSNVATTMSGGIAKVTTFDKDPYVLMYGFICTLGATFIWLLLATRYNLPVSSHHSVAGGIIGFALVYGGGDAVIWAGSKKTFPFVSGVVPIIISWFISPLLAGIVAAIIYALCRFLILERKNAKSIATYAMPVVVACTFFLEFLFIFMIAASSKLGWSMGHTAWMAAVVGGGAGVLSIALVPVLRIKIRKMERAAAEQAEDEGITVEEVLQRLVVCGRLKHQSGDKKEVLPDNESGEGARTPGTNDEGDEAFNEAEEEQRRLFNRLLNSQHHDDADEPANSDDDEYDEDGRVFRGANQKKKQQQHASTNTAHQHRAMAANKSATMKQRKQQQGLGAADAGSGLGYDVQKLNQPVQAEGNVVRDDDDEEEEGDDDMDSNDFNGADDAHNRGGAEVSADAPKKKKKKYGHYTYGPGGVHFFDPRAEYLFRFLQILTAACTSLAHGSNDVSNSIGPFAAIYNIYRTQEASNAADIPVWLLCIGGAGIVVGLATYGLNIMRLLGEKLAIITPVRGFSAELATALVVCFATTYSIPISSTHCITGAVLAISWMDMGTCGVKWMMVLKMYGGWIMTLVITGVISACFFAQGINSPMKTE